MGKIVKVSGPLVVATGLADANMSDVVRVGPQRLIGEILTMRGDAASIQTFVRDDGGCERHRYQNHADDSRTF
jgi:V/A-type H+-transporting ATPase subunit A